MHKIQLEKELLEQKIQLQKEVRETSNMKIALPSPATQSVKFQGTKLSHSTESTRIGFDSGTTSL